MKKLLPIIVVFVLACSSDQSKQEKFFKEGNKALDNGDLDEAILNYTNAINVDPNYKEAYNNRGVARMEDDNPYDAILDYNRALLIDPEYVECQLNRAYAFETIGQYQNSLRDINELISRNEDSAYYHFYQGLILTKLRSYRAAIESFKTSLSLGGDDTETNVNLGTLYYFLDKNDSARYFLNLAFDTNPRQPNALNTLALLELKERKYQQALYAIETALELVPDEPYFINNRGFIYLEMDSLERGLKDVEKSIVMNSDNGWAYRNKGIYHLKKGQLNRALELFERAKKSNEFIDELSYYIGLTYSRLGDKDQACANWIEGSNNGEKRSASMLFNCD